MFGYRETLQDIEKKRAFVSVLCKLFFKGHKKTLFEPLQIRDEFQPSLNYLQQNCLKCICLTHCDCKNQQIQAIDRKLLVCYHYSWVNLCENKLPWPYQVTQPLIGRSGGL